MIIFKCVISGDEMFSDTFKYKLSDDGVFYVVDGKTVTRKEGFDDSLIGANASAEEAVETNEDAVVSGVDIALNHKLQETGFNKESYMTHLKSYVKAVRARLQEEDPERAEKFAADVPKAIKTLIKSFKDLQFFTGESMNVDGMVALLNYNEDDKPYMLFFKDGLISEKV